MKKAIAILLFALLAGCATKGQKFDMTDVNTFQPGVSTYDEIASKLGKPYGQNFAQDGSKTVTWIYVQVSPVGSETRGTKMLFDKEGKLTRIMSKVEH